MFFSKSKGLTLTFIFALTIALALVTSSEATAYDAAPLRREHDSLKRLVRKRGPQNLAAVNPVAGGPATQPADPPAASAPAASTPPVVDPPKSSDPVVSSAAPPPASSAAPPPASSVPIVNSVVSSVVAAPTVSQPLAVTSLSSSVPPLPTTVAPLTTSTPPPAPTTAVAPLITSSAKKGSNPNIVTLTSEVSAASATATGVPAKNAAMQKTVTTVLIVIASVVGGTAVIWTIIRKWKFSPSNSFEDRMQPIDWQPTNDESGLPASRRLSNASSFHSAGHGENMAGYGVGAGYGATSEYGHGGYAASERSHGGYGSSDLGHNVAPPLQPLPDHDFTAPPATNLAPVGGYADLSRGPSPGPQMQEAYRGPVGYQGYDNSHDAYDYNGGTRY